MEGNNLLESTKKKIIAIELVTLVLLSAVIVFINQDNFGNIFSQSEPDTLQDDSFEEDDIIDLTNENVIEMIQQLDESMILGYIEKLVSFGPHPTARRFLGKIFDLSIEKVSRYIYNEFQSMGLEVRYQTWKQELTIRNLWNPPGYKGWLEGKNIEATLPGTDESSNEIYVMVAHYDTTRDSPGADDDGSGIAAMLSAAKLMSQYSFNHTIRFVTVSGHEQGLFGSYSYAKEARNNNDNIVATLCVDMIGYPGPNDRDDELRVFENEPSRWITDFTYDVNQRYSEYLNLEIFRVGNPKGHLSDYLNFWDFDFDTVFYHEIIMTDYRHSPEDTIENMDVAYATKISKLILATFAEFAWDNHNQ